MNIPAVDGQVHRVDAPLGIGEQLSCLSEYPGGLEFQHRRHAEPRRLPGRQGGEPRHDAPHLGYPKAAESRPCVQTRGGARVLCRRALCRRVPSCRVLKVQEGTVAVIHNPGGALDVVKEEIDCRVNVPPGDNVSLCRIRVGIDAETMDDSNKFPGKPAEVDVDGIQRGGAQARRGGII